MDVLDKVLGKEVVKEESDELDTAPVEAAVKKAEKLAEKKVVAVNKMWKKIEPPEPTFRVGDAVELKGIPCVVAKRHGKVIVLERTDVK
jgi:hypothetical protein